MTLRRIIVATLVEALILFIGGFILFSVFIDASERKAGVITLQENYDCYFYISTVVAEPTTIGKIQLKANMRKNYLSGLELISVVLVSENTYQLFYRDCYKKDKE